MFQNITQISKNKLFLLMILNGREWHYIAVKPLPALLRGITLKRPDNFYCLNSWHYFRTENKLKSHKQICENKDFCNTVMPFENRKILEFNQYQKFDKAAFIIYAFPEFLVEKIGCKNNPENSCTTKLGEHMPSGFSMSPIPSFKSIENKM